MGVAGASARREFEQRRSAREARTRAEQPHIGGLLLAPQKAPQHGTPWARGGEGEAPPRRSKSACTRAWC
jgi:hypothetical protein